MIKPESAGFWLQLQQQQLELIAMIEPTSGSRPGYEQATRDAVIHNAIDMSVGRLTGATGEPF